MTNRLFGPGGQPVSSEPPNENAPRLMARMAGRRTVEGEPRDIVIEAQFPLRRGDHWILVAHQLSLMDQVLRGRAELGTPTAAFLLYADRSVMEAATMWVAKILQGLGVGDADVIRTFERKNPPTSPPPSGEETPPESPPPAGG